MPSSIIIGGARRHKPGIYSEINAEALGERGVSLGNVAVVGRFSFLKAATPHRFLSPRAAREFFDNLDLKTLARLLFSPSTDARIPAGASSVTLVGVEPTTQAQLTLVDAQPAAAVVVKSRLWGPVGGRVFWSMANNAQDATLRDVAVSFQGETEDFVGLGSGAVARLYYDGADLDRTSLEVGPQTWRWDWEIDNAFAAGGGAQDQTSGLTDALGGAQVAGVALLDGAAGPSDNDVVVTLTGLDDEGQGASEVFTAPAGTEDFGSGAETRHDGAVKWSRIDSIRLQTADVDYNGVVTVFGAAFAIDAQDFESLGQLVASIDQNADKNYHAEPLHPRIGTIPATFDADASHGAGGADRASFADVLGVGSAATIRADLWAFCEGLSGSRFVTVERSALGDRPPVVAGSPTGALLGGTVGADDLTDWQEALEAIEADDIQIVALDSDSLSHAQELVAHCKRTTTTGYERQGWFGAPAGKTLAELQSQYTALLNSPYLAVVGQRARVVDARGRAVWIEPKRLAMMCAGAQAGTPVGTPLTHKRLDVLETSQSWDIKRDSEDAIRRGVVAIEPDPIGGLRVARSVTSWLADDNPALSEVSTWESGLTSKRDLRAALLSQIGNPIRRGDLGILKSLSRTRLDKQVEQGFIKAWRALQITDTGDGWRIEYEAAPIEPTNFIHIIENVVRISA